MARLQNKTCLSILRSILGPELASEYAFAKKIDMSVSWVKQTTSGHIPLTPKTASAIAYETGISFNWLLSGNTSSPPMDADGMPYTIESYARQRDKNNRAATSSNKDTFESTIADSLHLLMRVFNHAISCNQAGMFLLCLEKFARDMDIRFGTSSFYDRSRENAILQNLVLNIHLPEILDPEYERILLESHSKELGEKLENLRRQKALEKPKRQKQRSS